MRHTLIVLLISFSTLSFLFMPIRADAKSPTLLAQNSQMGAPSPSPRDCSYVDAIHEERSAQEAKSRRGMWIFAGILVVMVVLGVGMRRKRESEIRDEF